jgi:hypothetical protein
LADLAELQVRDNTFPGEVLMHIAVDALDKAAVDRQHPLDHAELLSPHLPEVEIRGKQQRRIQYGVLAAFAVHGGLDVDLLEEVTYWVDQYWQYALLAAIAIVRACAARSDLALGSFVNDLAVDYGVTVT